YTKLVLKKINRLDLDPELSQNLTKHLNVIEAETKRCGDIVRGLLDFSRKDQEDFKPVRLNPLLTKTYELIEHQMKMSNINFYIELNAENDLVYCNENQIKQVCVALLVNASEAVAENGEVLIRSK